MQYDEAIAKLFAMSSRGIRLGIQRMEEALRYRGSPHLGLRCVQVAGTNGKGSVSSMMAAVLRRAGYRTGLFVSPHLHRWVERVNVDGEPLDEAEAGRRIGEVLDAFSKPQAPEVTFFELTTLIALEVFRDRRCDVVVLETGLGGRLDATTAVTPEVGVITRVAFDHTHLLGDTIEAIAREKAGMIKPDMPTIVGVRTPAAQRVILERAALLQAPVRLIDRDFRFTADGRDGFSVDAMGQEFTGLRLSLHGQHQWLNAACAVAALAELERRGLFSTSEHVAGGLTEVRWPGRMEILEQHPLLLIDAAHNPDGCRALADFVADQPQKGPRVLVFGAMRDKDLTSMLRTLSPVFDRIIYRSPDMPRAAPHALLNQIRKGDRSKDVPDALAKARALSGEDGLVVVAGSIFLIAAVRALVLGVRADPSIRM